MWCCKKKNIFLAPKKPNRIEREHCTNPFSPVSPEVPPRTPFLVPPFFFSSQNSAVCDGRDRDREEGLEGGAGCTH